MFCPFSQRSRRGVRPSILIGACLFALGASPFLSAEEAPKAAAPAPSTTQEVGSPERISIEPQKFVLNGSRSQQQLIVTGFYPNGEVRDLTGSVQILSSLPGVAPVENGVVKPLANGQSHLVAQVNGVIAVAEANVQGLDKPSRVVFKHDMLAALTKTGCNMGACHGSPSGKGGFRLSLRGYDPPLDIYTLRSEFFGRRTNVMDPADSLLLKKPLMEVAHGGGRRLKKGDVSYQVMHDWISEGMKLDPAEEPELVSVKIYPEGRVFRPGASRQQIVLMGTFADGSVRDLTPLACYSSSNENVARVNDNGLVTKSAKGETAILARYLDKMATSYITFLEDVPGFAWNNPPEKNFVDNLVFTKLQAMKILPSELASDEEFLRRAYLDTTGRLPKLEEVQAFNQNPSPNKRDELIDQLVDSDDFASFWALKWADILRSNSKKINISGVNKFRLWIYESLRNDKPFDQFARELLTASGSSYENPAANYWRASRDPQDATETTAQLFLGVRIQCAKCHNHPFERWTQDNYYGIAAAFARIGRKPGVDPTEEVVFVQEAGDVTQPRTGKVMKTHLLMTGDVDVAADQDRRAVFAEWLTKPENPFFAKAAVNRVWGHLMGRGIVEPVDDFRDSNPPSNAPLLDKLASEFAANKFSIKWAVRQIMKSRTYQLSSRKNEFNGEDEIYASHANTRMLTAEQLLDGICQVTGVPENFPGQPIGTRATELPDPPTDHYFLKIFGQPQREMACQCERSSESNLSQALQMINGPVVHNKLRDDNGRINQLIVSGKTDDEIITTLYELALSRTPSPSELEASKKHIAGSSDRRAALEDVGWVLLNSKEFLFQH